jgi:hypothetical protein
MHRALGRIAPALAQPMIPEIGDEHRTSPVNVPSASVSMPGETRTCSPSAVWSAGPNARSLP